MSDYISVGRKMRSFDSSPAFAEYTKVVLVVSDDLQYEAGTDTGRTLEAECPWATQKMAENILSGLAGYRYSPYKASGALVDPAAELGDGVEVNGVYSVLMVQDIKFSSMLLSDISAPEEEETDSEYPYKSKQERKIQRQIKGVTTELSVQTGLIKAEVTAREDSYTELKGLLTAEADKISAMVSKHSETEDASFGWDLLADSWTIRSNGSTVLKATKDGLEISGHLKAATGEFTGTVQAGQILYGQSDGGADYGYVSGGAVGYGTLTGDRLVANTVTTDYTSAGINTSLGYANMSNLVFSGLSDAENISIVGRLKAKGSVEMFGYRIGMKATTLATPSGGYETIYYLTYTELEETGE